MKIIYISKSRDSIDYFKSLIEENDKYSLVGTYLFSDDYRTVIKENDVDCVVIDLTIDDCQDIKFMKYIREIDPFVVGYGNVDVNASITYTINNDLKYMAFLDSKCSGVRLNAFFASIANNIVEFNVSEFFDAYINDSSIVFDDEYLENFVAFLTCRRKKVLTYDEIVAALFPEESDHKKKILYHELCFKLNDFFDQIGMGYIFSYNQTKVIFNYHLIQSDYYLFLKDEFENFEPSYIDSLKVDFEKLAYEDFKNKDIQSALEFDELHFDDEVYIPQIEDDLEDEFSIISEEETNTESSFLEKAILKEKEGF